MYKIEPWKHQLNAIELSKTYRDLALFFEMGCGKTGAAINILRHKYLAKKQIVPTLILSPIVTLHNWKNEFAMHSNISPNDVVVIDKSGKARINLFKKRVTDCHKIVIVNYEALQTREFVTLLLEWKPHILVCDESHLCKNYKSKRAKAVEKIADNCIHRYILSGTPILNSALDLFQQFRILDKGETFGKNFFTYRGKYFIDKNQSWKANHNYFPNFIENPAKFHELNTLVYRKAVRVLKKDCLDLPPLVKERLEVPLSPEQKAAYKDMKNDYIAFIKDELDSGKTKATVAQQAMTKALRLMQIISGFVKTDEGEHVIFQKNPRLEITKELLEQLAPSHKVILWCSFKQDYKSLSKICTELNIPHVFITGAMNVKEKQDAIDSFNTKEETRVVIANRGAGGIGINLTASDYSIVYSRNFNLAEEAQSEARNHRGGSEIHTSITKINLCAPGTIDEQVLGALENKQKIADQIIDWSL